MVVHWGYGHAGYGSIQDQYGDGEIQWGVDILARGGLSGTGERRAHMFVNQVTPTNTSILDKKEEEGYLRNMCFPRDMFEEEGDGAGLGLRFYGWRVLPYCYVLAVMCAIMCAIMQP